MNKLIKFFQEKYFLSMVILFIISITLAVSDPLGLDGGGIESTSAIKALYFIPTVILIILLFGSNVKDKN